MGLVIETNNNLHYDYDYCPLSCLLRHHEFPSIALEGRLKKCAFVTAHQSGHPNLSWTQTITRLLTIRHASVARAFIAAASVAPERLCLPDSNIDFIKIWSCLKPTGATPILNLGFSRHYLIMILGGSAVTVKRRTNAPVMCGLLASAFDWLAWPH